MMIDSVYMMTDRDCIMIGSVCMMIDCVCMMIDIIFPVDYTTLGSLCIMCEGSLPCVLRNLMQ